MIGLDDLDQLIDKWSLAPGNDREWWESQGVDPDAITKFCAKQGIEDTTTAFARLVGKVGLAPAMAAVASSAYEIGMILGVQLEQQRKAAADGHH